MFLSGQQIIDRMRKGDLVIDPPPNENKTGPSVDIHLGRELLIQSVPPFTEVSQNITKVYLGIGETVIIHPGSFALAVSLELLKTPPDLLTLFEQRSSMGRIGLLALADIVDPGFQGKLVFNISNLGRSPVSIYPGMRVLSALFAAVEPSEGYRGIFTSNETLDSEAPSARADIVKLKRAIEERDSRLQTKTANSFQKIRQLLDRASTAKGLEKGKALEHLTREVFKTIEGLKEIGVNPRLRAEELDLVLQNDLTIGFWRFAGSPILIECKNWSEKVGSKEISVLFDKLQSLGPDVKTAILVAPNGVTGDKKSDAFLKIREKRQQGRYIVVLDRDDLEMIANGTHAAAVLERKFGEMWLI